MVTALQIVTSQNSNGPSRDWLYYRKEFSGEDRRLISGLRQQFKEENISKGKELLDRYCKAKGLVMSKYMKPEYQKKMYAQVWT